MNRDDNMRILDEPRILSPAADQVRTNVQSSTTGGLEPSTGARLRPESRYELDALDKYSILRDISDMPIHQGLDEPGNTRWSPPPPYEAVLEQPDGIDVARYLSGSSNEDRPSSVYGSRRHITAPVPPWDAELVAEFRRDPPGIAGQNFLLDRITDACEYRVLAEADGHFLVRAKYNDQQMVPKLRNSELDIGDVVVQDREVQTYFKANPDQIRGARLRVKGNNEEYRIDEFYVKDGVRWFEFSQLLMYGEMLRMIRLSHRLPDL
ncbi:uncharacterized protein EV420DRAFT_595314 [Desarmillaria tabescens]|uniref:Uncharacterized protein n=1 Tax=Armillaria tabescens TaxID=1929756 RepID=A0AA39K8N7_ARMTA|nr:uncharacterized protein EV420DRAFT_595314 [Desarmillaria tabescens]KAK0455336.1 hypothetical protein EV420DRAFT_595314 [Desarmillaria tabescens]